MKLSFGGFNNHSHNPKSNLLQQRASKMPRPSRASTVASALSISELQHSSFAGALLLDLGLNWAGWALSSLLKTEKFYDLTGSISFVATSAYSLVTATGGLGANRATVASAMVWSWAGRLGSFLFRRVLKQGSDSRFDGVRDSPGWLFVFWTMQATWVFVTLLPVLQLHNTPGAATAAATGPFQLAGGALWLAGLIVEAVADHQKSRFKQDPKNKDKFIDTGLWSLARYPNYGGEIALWTGMWVFCGATPLGALSPLFTAYVLTRLSGIPIQEKQAEKRWGNSPEYQAYKERTRLLVPLPRLAARKAGKA